MRPAPFALVALVSSIAELACCPHRVPSPASIASDLRDSRQWFVLVGEFNALTPNARRTLPALRASVLRELANDVAVVQTWPAGRRPTQTELDDRALTGVYLEATLTDLATTTDAELGSSTTMCKVELMVTLFPSGKPFATITSSGSVTGTSRGEEGAARAEEECVEALGQDLMRKRIAAAIRDRDLRGGPH